MPGAEADIDYTQPLSALLRQGTAKAHEDAENSAGAVALTRGELDKEEYVRFLIMLYYIYSTLEHGLTLHASHPTLAPTYNPTLLARTPALSADIAHLLDIPESSWRDHPLHATFHANPPAPLTAYVKRLAELADSADPSRLLAHAYVRYLGDLSGGQIIRRRVAKAYGLGEGEDDVAGTQFYVFGKLGGGGGGAGGKGNASVGDMRKIKEWYRDGMNEGGGEDVARKMEIVDEARLAFQLNTNLFTALRPPAARKSSSPTPILGDPTSPPTSPISPHPPSNSLTNSNPKSQSRVVAESSSSTERTYPLSSILVLCLAVGIAHFVLVVGGFTGAAGYGKYEKVMSWVEEVLRGGAGKA